MSGGMPDLWAARIEALEQAARPVVVHMVGVEVWMLLAALIVAAVALVLHAVWLVLPGGPGGRALRRELTALADDVQAIDDRVTREVKRRAGEAGVQGRRSRDEMFAEAMAVAAASQATNGEPAAEPPRSRVQLLNRARERGLIQPRGE